MVDQFSVFPMVARLPTSNTATVLRILLEWFQMLGFPEKIISDGGPQFRSAFKTFCKDHAIHHDPSSAYHAQGNGLAESAVKQTKGLLKKLGNDWPSFMMALIEFRNTPSEDAGASPAQQFFGRIQRTTLPILPGQTKLNVEDANKAAQKKKTRRAQQYAARNTQDLPTLPEGQRVLIQTPEGWNTAATVISSSHGDRSYSLRMDDGSTKRLNRRILMPIPGTPDHGASNETENAPNPDGDVPIQEAIHESLPPTTAHLEKEEATVSAPILRRSPRKHAVRDRCACCEIAHCKVISSNKNAITIIV